MIEFKQILLENDYKKAGSINYNRHKISKFRIILGIILIIIGTLLFIIGISLFLNKEYYYSIFGLFCIIYGIFMILRKQFYIRNLLKSIRTNENFGKEIIIKISDDGIIESKQNNDESKNEMKNFYGYYISDFGILLYPQKNIFLLLKKENINKDEYNKLLVLLDNLNIKIF